MTSRIAVFASAGGSNLQAILDYFDSLGPDASATIAMVASDRATAGALDRARKHGIPAIALDKSQRGEGMASFLDANGIDVIALAGYLRLLPASVTDKFRGRALNVHPSLLPWCGGAGMYGMRVHQTIISAGMRVSGVTVHFVDEQYDHGPIIAQWPVPVLPSDSPESLAARMLRIEHAVLPLAVYAVARGEITLGADNRVHGADVLPGNTDAFALAPDGVGFGPGSLFPTASR